MDLKLARIGGSDLFEGGKGAPVAFDNDNVLGTFREKRAGQSAWSGSYLHYRVARERNGGARNSPRQIEVEKKILAERAFGAQPISGDNFS